MWKPGCISGTLCLIAALKLNKKRLELMRSESCFAETRSHTFDLTVHLVVYVVRCENSKIKRENGWNFNRQGSIIEPSKFSSWRRFYDGDLSNRTDYHNKILHVINRQIKKNQFSLSGREFHNEMVTKMTIALVSIFTFKRVNSLKKKRTFT